MAESRCDGCGLLVREDHIARRIRRLELATRFRPIHIHLLFLAEAPPSRIEDYFYSPTAERSERTGLSRVLFDELMTGVGITAGEGKSDETCLAEFQKRNYFLADSLECPVEEIVPGVRERTAQANAFELAHRYGPTIIQRIRQSYKPRHIVLLSTRTRHLLPLFQEAGLSNHLLLYRGLPLHFPHPHNPAAQAEFRTGLEDLLSRASGHRQSA